MTAAVSLPGQPLSRGSPGPHVNDVDLEDMALTAANYTADPPNLKREEDVTFMEEDTAAAWEEEIVGSTQASSIFGTSADMDMSLNDEFLDFSSFSGMSDHHLTADLHDAPYFDLAATEGYSSAMAPQGSSSNDDVAQDSLDVGLSSCHQPHQLQQDQHQDQHQDQDHYYYYYPYEQRQDLQHHQPMGTSSKSGLLASGGGRSPGTNRSHNDEIGFASADAGHPPPAPLPSPLPQEVLALARAQPAQAQSQAADQPFSSAGTSELEQRNREPPSTYPDQIGRAHV